jgi:SNF2 family DNA or RNA helicase
MKTPLPHQIEDAEFLSDQAVAGNFSGMGSGKTLTGLEAIKRRDPNLIHRHYIIGPPISLPMWGEEIAEYFNIGASDILYLKTGMTVMDTNAAFIIMSYTIATKRAAELRDLQALTMTLDESHATKSTAAKRTKTILGKHGIINNVRHTWMLTGTPTTKWNDDLFPFLVRACPDALTEKIGKLDLDHFRLRYCITQKRKFPGARFPVKLVVGNRNTDELNEMVYGGDHPVAVRRELSEVWDAMPPLTKNVLPIKLDKGVDGLGAILDELKSMKQSEVNELVGKQDVGLSTMRRLIGLGRVDASVAYIHEKLDSGQRPILVGAWHTDVIDAIAEELALKKYKVAILDGRTSPSNKTAIQQQFNAGEIDVLIGQIAAMGVAINLQVGGNYIICVEEDWSPDIMDQFFARVYRMGQEHHVHIDLLRSDTKICEALVRIADAKAREHAKFNRQEETD